MTEKTKPADVQPGQLVMVMKKNQLPDRYPAFVMDPRHLIDTGVLPRQFSEHLVIQINNQNFTAFADEILRQNYRLVRQYEKWDHILFRIEKGMIQLPRSVQ